MLLALRVAGRHVDAAGAVAAVDPRPGREDVPALRLQAVNLEPALVVRQRVERGTRAVPAVGQRVLDADPPGRLAVRVFDDAAERPAAFLDGVEPRVGRFRPALVGPGRRGVRAGRGAVEPVAGRPGVAAPRDAPAGQVPRRLAAAQNERAEDGTECEAVESSCHASVPPAAPPHVATVTGRKIIPKLECRYRIFPFSFKSVKPNARPGFDPVVRRSGQLLQSPQSPAAGIRFPLRPVAVRWVAGAGRGGYHDGVPWAWRAGR